MRDRFAWLIGPLCTSILLFSISQALSGRFDAALPLARGISPEFLGWLMLGATMTVGVIWIVCWRNLAATEEPACRTDPSQSQTIAVAGRDAPQRPAIVSRLVRAVGSQPNLRLCAVWAVALNLPFAVTGQIWHSYDFSTHVFLASHYQQNWWSLWEPRWFEGFDVASYPPLTHQLAALLGWLAGLETAVNLLTAAAIVAFPIVLYRFIRQYLGMADATRVAALAVLTPSVLLAGYAFGQLPTLFALDASLLAACALTTFLRRGGSLRLATTLGWVGVVAAAHHATMLFFLPPLFCTIIVAETLRLDLDRPVLPRRAVLAVAGSAIATFVVILPFWVWFTTEKVVQLQIDHQSRHNFLLDPLAQDQFFWAEHGILVAGLLVSLPLLRRRFRTFGPWYLLAVYLLVLGLGGTTPLPRVLFGSFWEWLTYDRFSIWADVPLLLLFGAAASACLEKTSRGLMAPADFRETPERRAESSRTQRSLPGAAWLLTIGLLAIVACADALLPTLIQTEPVPIDPVPVVAFLAQFDHAASGTASWRYLTLGFGDQAGLLQAQTNAETVDGYFYTARRLPLLTQSGIASLDYSLLWDPNAKTLRALLLQPEPHHLRWVFTDDPAYEKILGETGWRKNETLTNGIGVWETNEVVAPVEPAPPRGGILAIWWGIAPLATLGAAVGLSARSWFRRVNRKL